jgi:hypothetical protein
MPSIDLPLELDQLLQCTLPKFYSKEVVVVQHWRAEASKPSFGIHVAREILARPQIQGPMWAVQHLLVAAGL